MRHRFRSVAIVATAAFALGFTAVAQAEVRSLALSDPANDVSCSGTTCPPDITAANVAFDRAAGSIAITLTFAAQIPPSQSANLLTFGLSNGPGSSCSLYTSPAILFTAFGTNVTPTTSGLGPVSVTTTLSADQHSISLAAGGPGLVGADLRCFTYISSSDSIAPAWFPGLAPLPLVAPDPVTLITAATARLGATIDAQGSTTSWHVEIGTSPSLGQRSGTGTVYGDTGSVPVSVSYSGLSPGTIYFYRFVATSGIGSIATPVASFITTPVLPVPAPTVATAQVGGRPLSLARPSISGTRRAGRTLTCRVGLWRFSPHLTVRWFAGTSLRSSARSVRVRAADAGKTFRCTVHAENAFGAASSSATARIARS